MGDNVRIPGLPRGDVASDLLFVNGTLMRGLDLHSNLDGAEFLEAAWTLPVYRIHSIGDLHPGMYEVAGDGISVEGELYRVPDEVWRRVQAAEPPGLYRGLVKLADGRVVPGILYARSQAEGKHPDISEYGGWRPYIAARGVKRR